MSREERRQYQRQMKSMERGPALPAAAQARAERNAARRAARKKSTATAPPGSLSRRFWIISVLVAAVIGYLAFSLQWPHMPVAAYLGLGSGALALAILVGFRYLQGRMAAR